MIRALDLASCQPSYFKNEFCVLYLTCLFCIFFVSAAAAYRLLQNTVQSEGEWHELQLYILINASTFLDFGTC